MVKNYISIVFFAFICAMSLSHLSAQERVEKYKVVVLEKSVDEGGNEVEKKIVKEGDEAKKFIGEMGQEWITEEGDTIDLSGKNGKIIEKRAYKMVVEDDDGNAKTLEWDGEGEMPAELKKILEENGIEELEMEMSDDEMEDIMIDVEVDDKGNEKKKIKIVTINNGKEEITEFEIDGDEIPEDVQKTLDEKGIDLRMNDDAEETKNVEVKVEVDASGKQKRKIRITSDEDGNEEVIELEYEGEEIPADVQKVLDENNIDLNIEEKGKEKKVIKIIKEEKKNDSSNKPQLGVLIENADKGVLITEVLPDSSADKAGLQKGDIVTAVNGSATGVLSDLQKAIAGFGVGDVISVDFLRAGRSENRKVTLQKKVSPFKFETWEEVMNSKEISIEKEVIIKKN